MKSLFASVLFVFGLVTLLLVARQVVQDFEARRVRGIPPRTVCGFQLKGIGSALHEHHDALRAFPAGTGPNADLPPESQLSWFVSLLPFLEQDSLYKKFDLQKAWYDDQNHDAARDRVIPGLCCPMFGGPFPSGRVPPTAYVGIAGVGLDSLTLPVDHPQAGFFGYDRVLRMQDIKDGASNTMCVMETTVENGPWTAGGPATVRHLDPSRQPYLGKGRQFGGLHGEGTMILLADGSARYVQSSINPRTLEALATIAGGETLPEDW